MQAQHLSSSNPMDDHQIISLQEGLKSPILENIHALWKQKRGVHLMPRYGEISPRDMKSHLTHIQLYEVIDGGHNFRVRVMGSAFAQTIGYDPTGLLVSELPDPVVCSRLLFAL